ncbi:MAG TPA: hypothetical protein VMG08_12805 [Allosphingosinicella sp.]|nr:hypothetical protein [Allosphingosinicella sp.]
MAFVAGEYRLYRAGTRPRTEFHSYASRRLRALSDGLDAAMGGEELGDNLDVWVDDHDQWSLSALSLALEPVRAAGRRTITVRFLNEGRPVRLRFHFVHEDGGWYLDDIVKPGRGGWTLARRLSIRPRPHRRP